MRKIIFALALISLAACSPQANQSNFVPQSVLPEALKDCAFFELFNSTGSLLRVVRCPSTPQKTKVDISNELAHITINNQANDYSCMNGFLHKKFNNPENHSVTYTQLFDGNKLPIACKL